MTAFLDAVIIAGLLLIALLAAYGGWILVRKHQALRQEEEV